MELKKYQIILGIIIGSTTVAGLGYKSVTSVHSKVTQINTNTEDIKSLEASVELDKLCELYRKALSDYYYWDAECKRTGNQKACEQADKAKRRVDRLEKQIADKEKETGEQCG